LDKALAQARGSKAASVRQLIIALLPLGRCDATRVASHLRISSRTLHSTLALEGHSFSSLLLESRRDLAMQQLRDSDRSMSLSQAPSQLRVGSSSSADRTADARPASDVDCCPKAVTDRFGEWPIRASVGR
jgi:AraC-like DNA-binding protein